jgi:hypothetical protein
LLSIIAVTLLLSTQAIADVSCVSNHKGTVTPGLMLDLDGTAYTEIDNKKTPLTGKYTCTVLGEEFGKLRLPHGTTWSGISKPYVQKWTGFEHHSIDGRPTGLQTRWYSNGKKLSQVNLVNSKGLMTWWYPTGEKAAQANVYIAPTKLPGLTMAYHLLVMEYYQMEGDYKSWYRNGNQSVTGVFNNGKLEVKALPWWEKWTEVVESPNGTHIYIDVNTIREHNDYVYYWILNDATTPISGYKSSKFYKQGDCGVSQFKVLSMIVYKQSMANGNKKTIKVKDEWVYLEPDNPARTLLDYACNYVK